MSVIDANSPADVLESFHVCSSHLLCITSVPGAKETDFPVDEALNRAAVEASQRRHDEFLKVAEERKKQGKLSPSKFRDVRLPMAVLSLSFSSEPGGCEGRGRSWRRRHRLHQLRLVCCR